MKFLLDSNIVIAASLGLSAALRERMAECDEDDLVTSAIVFAEVAYGSVRGQPPISERLQVFIEEVPILDFDREAGRAYATLSFKHASYDRLIAAHALSRGLVVVTDNVEDFADVPGLDVENWMLV